MSDQESAIKKSKGPCVILAGAGTGKTYTIVEKIKHLINNENFEPSKIVCLTFSNEAANSLHERILPNINSETEPVIKTFHSFCSDLLKEHGEKIGIDPQFKIILPDDAKILLHKNFKVQPYHCHQYISAIHSAKDLGITIEKLKEHIEKKAPNSDLEDMEKELQNLNFKLQTQFTKTSTPDERKEKKEIKEKAEFLDDIVKSKRFISAWTGYEKLKNVKKCLDYSDLNSLAIKLLKENPNISNNYEYTIVDEFQDTNKLQLDFLKLLASNNNITVVGDLNQSIYRFRGAYKENFNHFKDTFNTTKGDIFTLDKSYRSTNKILSIAHKLIQNNYDNKDDCFEVFSALDKQGVKTEITQTKNNKEEVRKIIEIIKSELGKGVPPEEICVMFRTHQQSRMLKSELEFNNIKFTSVTRKPLFKINEIKIALDILTILNKIKNKSQGADQSWWGIIHNTNFSKEDLVIISKYIKENKKDDCLSVKALNELDKLNISKQGKVRAQLLLSQIKSLIPKSKKPIQDLILDVYETTGLNNHKESQSKENLQNLQKFHELAQEYSLIDSPDLSSFIRHVEIMASLGIDTEAPKVDNSGIRIMTHHATKGLEYDTIIVSNMAQKRFPMEKLNTKSLIPQELSPELSKIIKDLPKEDVVSAVRDYEYKNQILEERRLCYVAFTRAKERLFITYSKEYGGKKALPSQFLNEIDYKKNDKINFEEDNDEKYVNQEENVQIIPASNKDENKEITFSPSSLQTFSDCQKKYEYRYIYNMPQTNPVSWESIKLGSFVHLVFEEGVKNNFNSEKQFIDLAKTIQMQEAWNFIDIDEAMPLIKVFFHRNKNKYSKESLTEKRLNVEIEGLKFQGIADRIDIKPNKDLEIIDYKTGSSSIKPKYRNWQLGFYAIASKSLGNPKVLTLDMLKKNKALEFEIDPKGNAVERNSGRMSFNLEEVKDELVMTAKDILDCYKNGFSACSQEKNCDFCQEYVWDN